MIGIVVDRLVSDKQFGCRGQWLAAARISGIARMSPTRNLQSDPVAAAEAMRGRPEVDSDTQAAIVSDRLRAGFYPYQRIADVERCTFRIDIAETGEEVRVLEAGPREQLDLYRPDDLQVVLKRDGRIGQNVRSRLQLAVVSG